MAAAADYLPPKLNTLGYPIYRIVPPAVMGEWARPVLLAIDPIVHGQCAPESICLAPAEPRATLDPLTLGPDAYYRKPECKRLAFHEGPHAYLTPEGHLMTFTRCACQDPGSTVSDYLGPGLCWHTTAFPYDSQLAVSDITSASVVA